jgi:hypothetical protein
MMDENTTTLPFRFQVAYTSSSPSSHGTSVPWGAGEAPASQDGLFPSLLHVWNQTTLATFELDLSREPNRQCMMAGMAAFAAVTAVAALASATATSSSFRAPPSPFQSALNAALTKELGHFADENGLGIWVAIVNESERVWVALGTPDGGVSRTGPRDIVPVGSYAKPWTAVAVLRLVERGLFALDDKAGPLIDP